MSIYIGLGSNLGNRLNNLEHALKEMTKAGLKILKTSPVYETPALLPPSAPAEWNKDFLNTVCEISASISKRGDFIQPQSPLSPESLLKILKTTETTLGRKPAPRWSPRIIDLDILLFENQVINTSHLKIPHPAITKRNFVLAPLKALKPWLKIPTLTGSDTHLSSQACHELKTVLSLFRDPITVPLPALMQIVNLTPDSFSDGDKVNLKNFKTLLGRTLKKPVGFLDLGAESTRPGATPLSPKEEWQRLKPYIELFNHFYREKFFRPRLSIDTRHAQTAEQALACGADLINDVSGLSQEMLKVLENTKTDYVLTHSLTIPADRTHTLPLDKDPVKEIKTWLKEKINLLEKHNISLERVIFDPGIGFGKTTGQSLQILKRIREFYVFPLRIMVGHSRKSFMKDFAPALPEQRDLESVGLSIRLALAGVDILRVHQAHLHARALRGYNQ